MGYPYNDDDFDGSYYYGLSENQIRERMNYAINGDDDTDDTDYGDLSDLDSDDDSEYDDDLD